MEFTISKFLRYGSKRFTLDDLANEIGISKKTIYQHFTNKEALVYESLKFLLDKITLEILRGVEKEKSDPSYLALKNIIQKPMRCSIALGLKSMQLS